jgi:hypothetical protein
MRESWNARTVGAALLGAGCLVIGACGGAALRGTCRTMTMKTAGAPGPASGSWRYSNADLANTRVARGAAISAANVSRLKQADAA